MAVILIPNLGGKLVQRLARHVAVIRFQAVHSRDELVSLVRSQRQNILFQFSQTHRTSTFWLRDPEFQAPVCRLCQRGWRAAFTPLRLATAEMHRVIPAAHHFAR